MLLKELEKMKYLIKNLYLNDVQVGHFLDNDRICHFVLVCTYVNIIATSLHSQLSVSICTHP